MNPPNHFAGPMNFGMAPPPADLQDIVGRARRAHQVLGQRIRRYERLKEVARVAFDFLFGFALGLLVLLVLVYLWPDDSDHAVSVSIPLVCKTKNVHYVETETSFGNIACSKAAYADSPTLEDGSFCAGSGGGNLTCYSQHVYYQRKKHVVTINMVLGGTIIVREELTHCADVIRKYWYVCDKVIPPGEEYAKIEHLHDSVIFTTYKVFHYKNQQENEIRAVSKDKKTGTVEARSEE